MTRWLYLPFTLLCFLIGRFEEHPLAQDGIGAGLVALVFGLYFLGTQSLIRDAHLTPNEKRALFAAILLLPLVGLLICQFYSSYVFKKRFRLEMEPRAPNRGANPCP